MLPYFDQSFDNSGKSLPTTCEVYDALKSPDEAESVTRILDKHLRDDMHNMRLGIRTIEIELPSVPRMREPDLDAESLRVGRMYFTQASRPL